VMVEEIAAAPEVQPYIAEQFLTFLRTRAFQDLRLSFSSRRCNAISLY
jgi:hypothetical protein